MNRNIPPSPVVAHPAGVASPKMIPASRAEEKGMEEEHLTKDGSIDHRFKGQREGADDTPANPNYTHAETGEVADDGTHLTKDGKPDRRYLENRALSEEEAKIQGAKNIINGAK